MGRCSVGLCCPDPSDLHPLLYRRSRVSKALPPPSPRGAAAPEKGIHRRRRFLQTQWASPRLLGAPVQVTVWVWTQAALGSGSSSSVFCPGSWRSVGCSPEEGMRGAQEPSLWPPLCLSIHRMPALRRGTNTLCPHPRGSQSVQGKAGSKQLQRGVQL